MSRRHETYSVCDVCGRKGAETWQVRSPAKEQVHVDLCTKCDDPVRKAWVAGRRTATGPTGLDTVPVVEDPTAEADEPHSIYTWVKAQEKRNA